MITLELFLYLQEISTQGRGMKTSTSPRSLGFLDEGNPIRFDLNLPGKICIPDPDVLAQEIVVLRRGVEDLQGALEQFREIAADLDSRHLPSIAL